MSPKIPLITHFGTVSLKWNKWVGVNDNVIPTWNKRSEVIQRLLAQTCELCKSQEQIEVRKLTDLRSKNNTKLPEWKKRMIE
ncbi:hypothetical protein [Wolbachia endosymbiont of Armadillidium arcangelii]|uniref:Uncharacterized protein n=1 Tax=Wolbachia endosymbiont of Armadillidium arcangelii TaxID=3158571 RepID=A0AAU7Q2V9_9RICK